MHGAPSRLSVRPTTGLAGLLFVGGVMTMFAVAAYAAADIDSSKIVGANACAECHKQEVEEWKGTHHFKTFRVMPRAVRADTIAKALGVRRVKTESLCLNCHFTVQKKSSTAEAISGISCESCHGAGQDWIKVHSGYSGKTALTESKTEASARWKLAEAKGMIRPNDIYRIAKNCYGCHVVPQEELVNKGGHRAGSTFELVSWSQGEVRHNTWHSKGKENVPADAARKRVLYVVGLGVELETALRGIAKATARKAYAFEMAARADDARNRLAAVAKAAPAVPELARMVEIAHSAALKLDNAAALSTAADGVSKLLIAISEKYDGKTLGGIDGLIPGPEKLKGKARTAGAVR